MRGVTRGVRVPIDEIATPLCELMRFLAQLTGRKGHHATGRAALILLAVGGRSAIRWTGRRREDETSDCKSFRDFRRSVSETRLPERQEHPPQPGRGNPLERYIVTLLVERGNARWDTATWAY